ncbi:hypothetical protein [Roseomonas xinghualingensis]|uniref:hypothetical protein n=1 Tax=Roseomonas xinghualingensis TaxID=2986475 RepID=UPI0021F1CE81|nr:hypothetical protein [Roseomonas sp. SXEYE001]MCV4209876.1 hypothetical protein [Roseomonas sp. SXEYE001]
MSLLSTMGETRKRQASVTATRPATDPGRQKDDFYRTPDSATRALLAVESLPASIWEPACGDGAISEVLAGAGHRVISTDLVDRGYGDARRDFLMERRLAAPCIVTNPPFKLADEFALHGLDLGVEVMALFMRLAWLEGAARRSKLWAVHPPARVWVFSRRQTLWRGDQEAQDRGGAIAFAWFVWTRGHVGAPALGWIP